MLIAIRCYDQFTGAIQAKREFARGEPSDHLAVLNAYRGWTLSKDKGAFCWKNFLSAHTLRMVLDMRNQVREQDL